MLRIFSASGCTCFIIYAIILNAIPVLITNGTLFCINIYYLRKLLKKKEFFDLIEFKGEEKMIDRFFQYYQQDIAGYFPSFQKNMLLVQTIHQILKKQNHASKYFEGFLFWFRGNQLLSYPNSNPIYRLKFKFNQTNRKFHFTY